MCFSIEKVSKLIICVLQTVRWCLSQMVHIFWKVYFQFGVCVCVVFFLSCCCCAAMVWIFFMFAPLKMSMQSKSTICLFRSQRWNAFTSAHNECYAMFVYIMKAMRPPSNVHTVGAMTTDGITTKKTAMRIEQIYVWICSGLGFSWLITQYLTLWQPKQKTGIFIWISFSNRSEQIFKIQCHAICLAFV